jgi:hypothetical protein
MIDVSVERPKQDDGDICPSLVWLNSALLKAVGLNTDSNFHVYTNECLFDANVMGDKSGVIFPNSVFPCTKPTKSTLNQSNHANRIVNGQNSGHFCDEYFESREVMGRMSLTQVR